MLGNTTERWGSLQIGLHWTVAALILIQVPAGWGMVLAAPGPTQDLLYAVHKNVGVIVFILACIRLVWRLRQPVPYLPADLPAWQASAPGAITGGAYMGIKSVTVFPGNVARSEPAVYGTYVLLNGQTGLPLAVGVPETSPLPLFTLKPSGSPSAAKPVATLLAAPCAPAKLETASSAAASTVRVGLVLRMTSSMERVSDADQ